MKNSNNKRNHNRRKNSTSSDDTSSDAIDFDQEDSDDANDEDDPEEDEPAGFAPSYGRKTKKSRKAGLKIGPSHLKRGKNVNLKGNSYNGNGVASEDEESVGSACSVSSVSSVSIDGSVVSDDSDAEYEGVDYVSDGDDEDVEKLEEELILDEFERGPAPVVVPGLRGLGDEWSGFDDLENRPLYSAGSFFDNDILIQSAGAELAADVDTTNEVVETPMPRRVHFADSDDSSDSEKTSEDELMSDFLLQESLDPDLRRMIENDSELPKRARNHQDLFATNEYYELPGNIYHVESSSEVGSSSGYECMWTWLNLTWSNLLTLYSRWWGDYG